MTPGGAWRPAGLRPRHWRAFLLLAAFGAVAGACATPPAPFSASRARRHVAQLAGTIGSRPTGSVPNRRAREYLVDQLQQAGFAVRVQEADAQRAAYGVTARVANIVATLPGSSPLTVALMAHYDSVPDGPGAADDAFGVAVCLEAGRVLAARPARRWTTAVVLTDGEELGLMGASALLRDPVSRQLRAVLNFEAIGSGAPVMLFESGTAGGALVEAWARNAPRPAGASFMTEIYKGISRGGDRTDLGVVRRAGIAGLDFAAVGDGYTYHTPLDAPGRLDEQALRQAGENAVATAVALDAVDLSTTNQGASTYFDILRLTSVAYGRRAERALLAAGILAALVAWWRVAREARRRWPLSRLLMTVLWVAIGLALVGGAMIGATWLLRASRASLHPWYAHPGRLIAWLVLAGLAAAWALVQLGRLLPEKARGAGHAAMVWAITLPVWGVLAVVAGWLASGAAFLMVWPLLAAATSLLVLPVQRPAGMRAASALVAAVVGILWVADLAVLVPFVVAELDRAPLVTPLVFFPVLLLAPALVVVPPLLALFDVPVESRRRLRGWKGGVVVTGLAALAFVSAWLAPAYTRERPQHHVIRFVADGVSGRATWETGANEAGPPGGHWMPGGAAFPASVPLEPLASPFVYHASAPSPGPPPFAVSGIAVAGREARLEVRAVPSAPGWTLAFVLPEVELVGASLPVSPRRGRQVAVFQAVPPEGVTFRGQFRLADAATLRATLAVAVGPGLPGAPWPRLPAWLPQQHDVWQARSYYVLPIAWQGDPGA